MKKILLAALVLAVFTVNKKLRHKAAGKYNPVISKIVDDCPGTLHAY